MTSFSREQSQSGHLTWEIRSVNHRYLDLNFRLPEIFRELETKIREITPQYLSRGKVDIGLRYQAVGETSNHVQVNVALAKSLLDAATALEGIVGESARLQVKDLLRWPGMVDVQASDTEKLFAEAISLYHTALQSLTAQRSREGDAIKKMILERLEALEKIVINVKSQHAAIVQVQREKILQRLEEAKINLDPTRLEQEMVLVATKIDVMEEIDRLLTHIKEARHILNSKDSIGRRLDFLMQEFNREANTLGSKSVSLITTSAAVEMKVLIEQMREQIQNIE